MKKRMQLKDHAGSQERLTLYRWENSISRGVRKDRGNGFTVTEMTLEFRTVLFLWRGGERDVLKGTEGLVHNNESQCIWHWCPSFGVRNAEGVGSITLKCHRRHLLLMDAILCPSRSPHSHFTFIPPGIRSFYEPHRLLKLLDLKAVSIPEIKWSWIHFLSLTWENRAHFICL